jgi:hypothetical protein
VREGAEEGQNSQNEDDSNRDPDQDSCKHLSLREGTTVEEPGRGLSPGKSLGPNLGEAQNASEPAIHFVHVPS